MMLIIIIFIRDVDYLKMCDLRVRNGNKMSDIVLFFNRIFIFFYKVCFGYKIFLRLWIWLFYFVKMF